MIISLFQSGRVGLVFAMCTCVKCVCSVLTCAEEYARTFAVSLSEKAVLLLQLK